MSNKKALLKRFLFSFFYVRIKYVIGIVTIIKVKNEGESIMSLGKNIQYLRKQKKITQEQLAEEMSVSRQTVSKWEADYAVITVYDPFVAAFERIPNAYKRILDYLHANGFREKPKEDILSCFEYVYEQNGRIFMDVYIHVDSVSKAEAFTNFS